MANVSTRIGPAQGEVIGMDLGDRMTQLCVISKEGEVLEEARVRTATPALESYLRRRKPCRVVLEAGSQSPWVQRLVRSCGHEAVVLNPHKVRVIAESVGKSDEADAAVLADLGRIGLGQLRVIEHRSEQAQADMAVLRARGLLVKQRTMVLLHVKGTLKANGYQVVGRGERALWAAVAALPERLRGALVPLREQAMTLRLQIAGYDRMVGELIAQRYPEANALQQIPGVGPITSLTFVLTLGDSGRFRRSRQVGAYVGLIPKRRQSGKSDPQLGITKAGDKELRRLLVQCSQYILSRKRADSDLQRWGLTKAEGGKNHRKRAVVAVARKLAVLMHRLWVTGEVYEPFRKEAA